MKSLITIFILLPLTISVKAQSRVSYKYTEINKSQFSSCSRAPYLIVNTIIKKRAGKLTIPISGKAAKIFQDNDSEKNYVEFEYLGDIKATNLSLVKKMDYNGEEFYSINRTNGTIDTLIGRPVFAKNMRDFASINNPGTDEKQQIQIGEITKDSVHIRILLKVKADAFFEDISCINRDSILIKENNGKYWKLSF